MGRMLKELVISSYLLHRSNNIKLSLRRKKRGPYAEIISVLPKLLWHTVSN